MAIPFFVISAAPGSNEAIIDRLFQIHETK